MPFYRARVWSRFQETPLTEVMLDDAIRRLAALALDQMGNVNRERLCSCRLSSIATLAPGAVLIKIYQLPVSSYTVGDFIRPMF